MVCKYQPRAQLSLLMLRIHLVTFPFIAKVRIPRIHSLIYSWMRRHLFKTSPILFPVNNQEWAKAPLELLLKCCI
jgi:hypothetical protein